MRDAALEVRELLEQPLALLERGEQPRVLRRLPPLVSQHPDEAKRDREHAAHAAREVHVLAAERVVAGPREDEAPVGAVVERDDDRGAAAETGDVEQLSLARRDLHELRLGDPPARKADRSDDGAVANDGSELRLERLGCALDGSDRRGLLVVERRDDGEELGQLLGRPGAAVQRQLTARTTRVSLLNPAAPRTRAISP